MEQSTKPDDKLAYLKPQPPSDMSSTNGPFGTTSGKSPSSTSGGFSGSTPGTSSSGSQQDSESNNIFSGGSSLGAITNPIEDDSGTKPQHDQYGSTPQSQGAKGKTEISVLALFYLILFILDSLICLYSLITFLSLFGPFFFAYILCLVLAIPVYSYYKKSPSHSYLTYLGRLGILGNAVKVMRPFLILVYAGKLLLTYIMIVRRGDARLFFRTKRQISPYVYFVIGSVLSFLFSLISSTYYVFGMIVVFSLQEMIKRNHMKSVEVEQKVTGSK